MCRDSEASYVNVITIAYVHTVRIIVCSLNTVAICLPLTVHVANRYGKRKGTMAFQTSLASFPRFSLLHISLSSAIPGEEKNSETSQLPFVSQFFQIAPEYIDE